MAFGAGADFRLASLITRNRLIPEDDEDRAFLDRYGTDAVDEATRADVLQRLFAGTLSHALVAALAPRIAGVRLYADAMRAGYDVGQYRELWRVLESAFKASGNELISHLTQFQPVADLGISRSDLETLHVLRGRASHAESRDGLVELTRVEQECRLRLPELKRVAELVILTKSVWGSRSPAVHDVRLTL